MPDHLSFGYWVRRRRKALDLTQADLGRLVGASAAMIRKIEAEERRPSRELADLLAKHLAVSAAERESFLRAARDIATVESLVPPIEAANAASILPPSNLPAPMTSMVNRVNDLAAITALLRRPEVRLVTLLGPPGMGKTRLSIQAADDIRSHFPDGVWFVDLSAIVDPDMVLPAITLVLNLPLAPAQSAFDLLKRELRSKTMLLVLDNFEQVVEGAAVQVSALLQACRGLKIITTSRIRLNIYGEFEYPLAPMTIPPEGAALAPAQLLKYEAVQLFVDRTRQHHPGFEITARTAAPVVEICQQMEGLPLALELAAARTRRMPVEELAVALREAGGQDWHALLQNPVRDLPPRQQTLSNAIAWSDSLLEWPLQTMLRQLGVFAGPFDWPAVDAVINIPGLADGLTKREALERLVDHNLVSKVSTVPERWRLLEMVREFARDQLGLDQFRAASWRHAEYYATVLSGLARALSATDYLNVVDAMADNCRAALQWAIQADETLLAYRLSAAFEWYWEQRGLMREGFRFLERTLALTGDVDEELRFSVLQAAANQAWMQHNLIAAHRLTAQGIDLAYQLGNHGQVAGFLNLQARVYLEEGQFEMADQALVEAIRLGNHLPRLMNPNFMIIQRGEAALGLGRLAEAEARLREGLAGVTPSDVIPFCVGWTDLAEVMLARKNLVAAYDALQQVAPLAHLHIRRARIYIVAVAGCLLATNPVIERRAIAAVRLLAWVNAANEQLGDPLSVMLRRLIAERMETARMCLSPAQWQKAWEGGRGWTYNEAMAFAREAGQISALETVDPAPQSTSSPSPGSH